MRPVHSGHSVPSKYAAYRRDKAAGRSQPDGRTVHVGQANVGSCGGVIHSQQHDVGPNKQCIVNGRQVACQTAEYDVICMLHAARSRYDAGACAVLPAAAFFVRIFALMERTFCDARSIPPSRAFSYSLSAGSRLSAASLVSWSVVDVRRSGVTEHTARQGWKGQPDGKTLTRL